MYGKLKINCTLYSTTIMFKFGEGNLLDALYVNFAIHKLLRVQFKKLLFVIRLPAALPVKVNSKTVMKHLQSTFAAKLRKANYSIISIMRLKLAELNCLKLTLPNPTHCFAQ